MPDAFDTTDVSTANMSAEDIDALLEKIAASTEEVTKHSKDESTKTPPVAADAAEANEELSPDASEPAAGEGQDGADLPTAADPEAALNQVDQDLTDLENMLAETVNQIDAESSAEASSPETELSDEESAALAEAATPSEASDSAAGELEPATAEEANAEPADSPEATATPTSQEHADTPPLEAVDEEATEAAGEESPPQPGDEAPPSPPTASFGSAARTEGVRLGRIIAVAGVGALVALDAPFANVSLKAKTILGYVGIATLIVALATWILGPVLRPP